MLYQHCFSGLLKVNTQEKCSASVKCLFQLQHNWKALLQTGINRDSLWSCTTACCLHDIPLWRHIFDGYIDTAFQWRAITLPSAGVHKSWAQFSSFTKSCMTVPSICSTITAFLVNDQHDTQISFLCIYFYLKLSTCFEHIVLIIRRDKLYQYSLW